MNKYIHIQPMKVLDEEGGMYRTLMVVVKWKVSL